MTDLLGSTSTAGTGGSFPQSSSTKTGSFDTAQILAMSPAQFAAAYDVSSTQLPLFIDSTTGKLNANAADLAWYYSLTQSERQSIQSAMVSVGALSPAEANGLMNSTSITAFKQLIGVSQAQGTDVVSYLQQNATGTNGIQNAISANLTKAQENAIQPITATVENPTTLSADITAAFENALGYSPDQAQIDSFINQVQNQDTTYAEAPRTEAQQQINMAHSEESALNKLGPDGIDSVIQAYQAAVNGTNLPGAGTVQGPVNGSTQNTTTAQQANMVPAGQQLPKGNAVTFTPQGTQVGMSLPPKTQNVTTWHAPSILDQIGKSLLYGSAVLPGGSETGPTSTATQQQTFQRGQKAPAWPSNVAGATKTYGGIYALSAKDWKAAQSDYAPAKKYNTPGAAPESVQLGAFSALLSSAYDSTGSWSKAVAQIASGTPFGTAEGTNLTSFGNQVASQVNSQIEALQNQVNNDTVTTKVSAPDAVAEADLAAKQSDPSGYEAAQEGSWGEVLNTMLSGTPEMYNQSSTDTFTGPVAAQAETSLSGSTGTA